MMERGFARDRSRSPRRRHWSRQPEDDGYDRWARAPPPHDRYRRPREYEYDYYEPEPWDYRGEERGYRERDYDRHYHDRNYRNDRNYNRDPGPGGYEPQSRWQEPPPKLLLLGPMAVAEFQQLFASTNKTSLDELDECVFRSLADFDDRTATDAIAVFARGVMTKEIKDNTAFFIGILKKFREKRKANPALGGFQNPAGTQAPAPAAAAGPPGFPFFAKLGPLTQTGFQELFSTGMVRIEEIDDSVFKSMGDFEDSVGREMVDMFASAFTGGGEVAVRNKTGFMIGILKKFRRAGRGAK